MEQHEITEILNRPISQELLARDLTRLAYVAEDGAPRNVPVGFTLNGSEVIFCTTKNVSKCPRCALSGRAAEGGRTGASISGRRVRVGVGEFTARGRSLPGGGRLLLLGRGGGEHGPQSGLVARVR